MFSQPRFIALGSIVVLALVLATPRATAAQSTPDNTTPATSGHPPVTAWASVGLGPGNTQDPNGGSLAGVVRANVSVGPWLLMYRGTDVGPFMSSGSGVRDAGLLAGARTGGHRFSGDIGPSHSTYSAFTLSVELGWFGW